MNRSTTLFRRGAVGVVALAMTVMLSACNGGSVLGPNPNAKVATVDGTVITRGEYDKTYKLLTKNMRLDLENISDPNQKQMYTQALTQMTLNKLILDALVENEAKTMGLTVTEAEVKTFKENKIEKDPKAKAEFKKYLDENMLSEKDFDETLKQNLLTEKVIEKKAGQQLSVSDKDVDSFYKGHPEQFKMPEQIKASHILVKAIVPQMERDLKAQSPSKSNADIQKEVAAQKETLKKKADDLYAEVKASPAKFADVAKRNSNDPGSAARGGDLDYVVQSNIDPAFWAALKQTKVGQLHDGVVETQFGYHIIKVEDVKAAKDSTLAEMRPLIHDYLLAQKKQQILMQWSAEKRAMAKIDVQPEYQPKTPAAAAEPGTVQLGAGGAAPAPQAQPPVKQ